MNIHKNFLLLVFHKCESVSRQEIEIIKEVIIFPFKYFLVEVFRFLSGDANQ